MPGTRKSIDYIIATYELEPQVRELWVEGPTDRMFLQWFFDQKSLHRVHVYEIDLADIGSQVCAKHGLRPSKRSQVIALALECEQRLELRHNHLCLVADRDFDAVWGFTHSSKYLFYTDHSCLDGYFMNEKTLHKALQIVGCGISGKPGTRFFESVVTVLRDLFCISASNVSLDWSMRSMEIKKYLQYDGNAVKFRSGSYIDRYLKSSSRFGQKSEFERKLQEVRKRSCKAGVVYLCSDHLHQVLPWIVQQCGGSKVGAKYKDSSVCSSLLRNGIDLSSIAQEKLFRTISRRLR